MDSILSHYYRSKETKIQKKSVTFTKSVSQQGFYVSSFWLQSHYAKVHLCPDPPSSPRDVPHLQEWDSTISQFSDHQNWIKDQHWFKTAAGILTPMAIPPWIASPAYLYSPLPSVNGNWECLDSSCSLLSLPAPPYQPTPEKPKMPHGQIHSHTDKGSQFSISSSEPRSALGTNDRMLWLISNKMKVQSRREMRKTSPEATPRPINDKCCTLMS